MNIATIRGDHASSVEAQNVYNEFVCRCRVKVKRCKIAIVPTVFLVGNGRHTRVSPYVWPGDAQFYPVDRQPKCGCLPGSMCGNAACPHGTQVTC